MNQRRLNLRPPRHQLRAILLGGLALLALFPSEVTYGQEASKRSEIAREPRRHTWSAYIQGGTSWADGVGYENLNPKSSYALAPALGGGVDFDFNPWLRVSTEYLYSRYRREQRMSVLNTGVMPIKAYGNYVVNYHNAKLGGGVNALELLWSKRKMKWLNAYLGTGLGYMIASGTEHGIYLSNTKTQAGITTPLTAGASIDNTSSVLLRGNVRTTNAHLSFEKLYVPTSLHVEAELTPEFALGLKGEMDWVINPEFASPKHLVFALATVRYTLATSKARLVERYYRSELESLNGKMNALRQECLAEQARAQEAADKAKREYADLDRRLRDCLESLPPPPPAFHVVLFAHDRALMSHQEAEALKAFAQVAKGRKLSLLAEASTPGTEEYNQALSERRLKTVVKALIAAGFDEADLDPRVAIGSQAGISTSEGRRVTITVQNP